MTRVSGLFQKSLKNRSSKDLRFMTGVGRKPILRCVSNEQLSKWAAQEVPGAVKEQNRRAAKRDKKEGK